MPSLRRHGRKSVDFAKGSSLAATSDELKGQSLLTLDNFILAHKLSSTAEQALRSKSEDVIQRVLSQGPLQGGNPNLALAGRLWSEQAGYSDQPQAQQVHSEQPVDSVAGGWARWLATKRPSCRVGDCAPCKRSENDPSMTEAALNGGKAGQDENSSADAQAVVWYTKAAEEGEADAQFKLGACYANGMGVGKDEGCAAHWYELAAEQGMVDAQFNLGLCYKHGIGVAQDLKLALRWFTKAGNKAHVEAQFNVALCYQHGEGVNVDAAKAARWFKKAASKGHSRSQFQLGLCHSRGLGVPREAFFAFVNFRAAALQDLDVAEYKLAVCYHRGVGVEKDMDLAIGWYTRAAEQGHSKAQYSLAVCYLTGDGIPLDVQQGMTWMQRAAEQGHPTATAVLED
eukprot:TRINITY_DN47391_c0_g1_i1.p1 TRINITY_DN47391_c0_g1~~TRINITY_DN47391_c0_g1_i1.p1  ORF type:complete len:399 (-),score=78.97 TRINITY_DN47391_c0_g1_i1:188-1384(-)